MTTAGETQLSFKFQWPMAVSGFKCKDLKPETCRLKPNITPPTSWIDNNTVSVPTAEHNALLRMVRTHVGRALLCVSLLLLPVLTGCGDDDLRYAEMREFYTESQTLPRVPLDSVERFSGKVTGFVGLHPSAADDPLYPRIQENIRSASVRVSFYVEPAWKDTTDFKF